MAGGSDVFIAKFSATGSAIYATYLGGKGYDQGMGIAVDGAGNAYVTGETSSSDFPTVNPFQPALAGSYEAFVAKLNAAGKAFVYSTYLGGKNWDTGYGIAVDGSGNAYVTGYTSSTDFPTVNAFQPDSDGSGNVFVTKLNPQGSAPVYSTYIGGHGSERGKAIAMDSRGNAYITGYNRKGMLPTANAIARNDTFTGAGLSDTILGKYESPIAFSIVDGLLTGLVFELVVAGQGCMYTFDSFIFLDLAVPVTNNSFSYSFPDSSPVFKVEGKLDSSGNASGTVTGTYTDPSSGGCSGKVNMAWTATKDGTGYGGYEDAFVAKLNSLGNSLVYSIYLGGIGSDYGNGIAVDPEGNAFVSGGVGSHNFKTVNPLQAKRGSIADAFITKISPSETDAEMTLFFPRLVATPGGSSEPDERTGIAVANMGTTDATVKFTAFDKTGAQIEGANITNPSTMTLKAGEQLPIMDTQIFGAGLLARGPVRWMKAESNVSKLAGFFLMFNSDLSFQDGADVSPARLTSFIFPEIEDQGFTQINVTNPDAACSNLTFDLLTSEGKSRTQSKRTANPNGAIAEFFTDLFPGVSPVGSDYIRVTSTIGAVPFEYLGKSGKFVSGLNGQPTSSIGTTLYSPQYVVGGTAYRTTLSVVNLESTSGTVTFKFIKDDGTQIGVTKQMPISAKGKISIAHAIPSLRGRTGQEIRIYQGEI